MTLSRQHLLALALTLALALGLAACGGGDDDGDGGGDDEAEITEVIQTSATSTDPADCTLLQTQAFLEQSSFETGETAVEECEEEATDTSDDPDSVTVSNVSVDGDTATADAAFVGGPLDGSVVTLDLVNEDDQWKLDRLTDIPQFNFKGFQTAFAEQIANAGDIPPQVGDCIVEAFGNTTEEDLKEVIISGDETRLNSLFVECIPEG